MKNATFQTNSWIRIRSYLIDTYPKIKAVKPLVKKRILVTFDNNLKKIYDCSPLLKEEIFSPLTNNTLFECVKIDVGGYGISWNDKIDLSESELWVNGDPTEQAH